MAVAWRDHLWQRGTTYDAVDDPGGPSTAAINGLGGPSMARKIAIDGPGGLILGDHQWHDRYCSVFQDGVIFFMTSSYFSQHLSTFQDIFIFS